MRTPLDRAALEIAFVPNSLEIAWEVRVAPLAIGKFSSCSHNLTRESDQLGKVEMPSSFRPSNKQQVVFIDLENDTGPLGHKHVKSLWYECMQQKGRKGTSCNGPLGTETNIRCGTSTLAHPGEAYMVRAIRNEAC